MDKERIDGFRSAFAPGETLFWQVPAAARERMAFYSENLPRLFLKKSRRYLRCPTTMRWNLCDFCRDRASAALKPCGTAPPAMPASFCRWSWWNGKAQGGCHVRLYEDPLQNRHSCLQKKAKRPLTVEIWTRWAGVLCLFSEYNGEPDLLFRLAQVKSAAIGDGHAQLIERTGGKFRYSLAVLVCDRPQCRIDLC